MALVRAPARLSPSLARPAPRAQRAHHAAPGTPRPADAPVTRRAIARLAWPIVLANASIPLLGLADTAVIGNVGTVAELGAIGLGAVVFSFVFWSFGFLRMGTTGFVAQASGRGESAEVRAIAARALLLAALVGVLLVLLQQPIAWLAQRLLAAPPAVAAPTASYIAVRIWAAPASLAQFVVIGVFVGLGRTRAVLALQLLLNGVNIALDVLFAGVFQYGVRGIALGTALAEWTAAGVGIALLVRALRRDHTDDEPWWPRARLRDMTRATQLLRANGDLMVRTLFLLLGFGWFARAGATFGAVVLAANHVLLQLVSTSAYLLDGFAHATEILVGRAVGRRDRGAFVHAVRRATELAGVGSVLLAVLVLVAGPWAVAALTALGGVREAAVALLPWTAAYVLLSFAAFQLDGVYIGATATRPMRNASVVTALAFIALSVPAMRVAGNAGLWAAFCAYVLLRGVVLGVALPRILPPPTTSRSG